MVRPTPTTMVLYGQIVMGAPGAGKTTYCDGMQQYLRLLGRECLVVNLDPANEVPLYPTESSGGDDDEPEDGGDAKLDEENGNAQLPYETILDVCEDIISLDAVMQELRLGPNGGLLYCMEYIEHHLLEVMNLLKERLNMQDGGQKSGGSDRPYLLFDLPGQIELTAHSNVVSRIAQRLVRELDLRMVCVQLVDAAVCLTDVAKFIGAALVCTSSMMRIGEEDHVARSEMLYDVSWPAFSRAANERTPLRQRPEQNGSSPSHDGH